MGQALAPLQPALALIFGSIAGGTETAASDVDLLVISDLDFANVVRALHPAQTELGRDINPVVYSLQEIQRRVHEEDPFVLNLLAGPKIFLIGTDHDLSQLAGYSATAIV